MHQHHLTTLLPASRPTLLPACAAERLRSGGGAAERNPLCCRRHFPPLQRLSLTGVWCHKLLGTTARYTTISLYCLPGCPCRPPAAMAANALVHPSHPHPAASVPRLQHTGERRLHIAAPWMLGGIFLAVLPTVTRNGNAVRSTRRPPAPPCSFWPAPSAAPPPFTPPSLVLRAAWHGPSHPSTHPPSAFTHVMHTARPVALNTNACCRRRLWPS
jgi:hypothetical protein